jgi:ABC-2 type transport system permease protein
MTRVNRSCTGHSLRAYGAFARMALRQRLGERSAWLGQILFLGLVILIFSRLWQALLPARALRGYAATDCVWYIAITEWIVIAQPRVFLGIERDVRNGDLAYRLGRPISYLASKLAEAFAEQALALLLLGCSGALFAYACAGGLPADAQGLLWALPLGLLASVLYTLCSALIGVSAFWLVDCSPLAWLFQKLTFAFGGLLVPLTLYPDWLRELALLTPFAALMFGPGSMALAGGAQHVGAVALQLSIWIALALGLLSHLYARGVRALELHGG